MRLRAHAAATHAGRKRRRNEDAYVQRPPLFAVADGMGGAQAGEVASRLAAAVVEDDASSGAPEERVVALIEEANRRVFQRAYEDAAASGMGTTMTIALVDEDRVTIGHVGDSRAYRLRDSQLEQLTEDHSLVAELVRSGKLAPEEADSHPQRNVITRVLGSDPDVDVDVFTTEAEAGDVFLLCSDGLTTMVGEQRIVEIFAAHAGDLDSAARALVNDANRGGGEDNITVVCFEMGGSAAVEETQPIELDPPTAEQVLDEDDTLSGLDGTPAIEVVEPPAAADQDAVASRAGPSWFALGVLALVVGAIVVGVLLLLGVP